MFRGARIRPIFHTRLGNKKGEGREARLEQKERKERAKEGEGEREEVKV